MKRGKRYKVVKRNVAIAMLLAMLNSMLFADIKVDRNIPQKTSVDRAQNGANIVNINTPNGKGISVNDFSEFRTKDPTVFNNFGQGVGRSYLAGMMASNPNLTKEQAARLILNRVGGNNRVEIENWLEVMSENKTEVVFSSNQGFYLNNTGFINFDKVMFTTSRVDLDGNGDLLPFNIRGGKIEIGREGINAEGVRYLAFLSKQISIDGQVYAKDADVDLIAGDFDYNPNTREHTKQGINNNELLISSSAFGSMYGNQIKIVAVNGNVGVAGDNIAQKVLKINADGTIVTNKNQGNEGIEIKGKEFTQNSSTYTEGNLTIDADKTILKGNGTQAGNILITGELENEVNVYSGADINIGKGLLNKSGQIVAERNISVGGKADNRDLVYAKGNIGIGKELNNTGNIQSNGSIKAGGDTINTGKILSEDELEINGKLTSSGTVYGKNKVEVKDKLDNSGDIQSEGNITVGSDTKNTGRIITDKNIEISGNLGTEETVYAKENLNVKGNLLNKKDIQAEGNITVEKDTINQGRLLSDKELKIKGNTNNSGTLYGKDKISLDKNLTNTGTIQTSGDLTAKDTINTGKIVSEGNVSLSSFDNSGELTINKKLTTTALENKTGAKINTGEGIQSNGVRNYGEINSNSNFLISGNLENYNIMNIGGLLTANDLLNTGNLKAVEKIYTSGASFNNSGEILTTLLDINNTGILNTNKITVIDDARLNGSNVTNNGYISGTNIEIITAGITNTGTLAADGLIKVNNTTINNTGYIGSNTKVNLSGSNLTNSGVIESSEIELYNMSGYNNLNLIRGGNVSLTTTGNINLTGTLHGENWLQIHGYNILNAGATTGTGYIEIKGRDITNNTELASNTVVIEGTGNIVNNNIITGENGRISGNTIVNNDLIAFSDQLGLTALDKITNNAGKAIYGGNLLDAQFNTLENLSGELLSTGTINLRGNYLLNQTGMIQSSGDIALNITKIDNIGRVDGLNDYEIYYETWDGQILTEAEVMNKWRWEEYGENKSNKLEGLYKTGLLSALDWAEYQFLLANIFLDDLWSLEPGASDYKHFSQGVVEGYFDRYPMDNNTYVRTSSAQFPGVALKGKIRSNAVTTYANISAGNNISITANELNNKDGKISAGNTAELTASTIRNQTTLGDLVQLKDGVEYYKQEHYGSGSSRKYHVKYWRGIENGDQSYVTGQASVIEARNLIINTGNLELTSGVDTSKQIIDGSTASGGLVGSKTVNTGVSNGTGLINIVKNMTPVIEIVISGVLPMDPLGAVSSLFTMTEKPSGNDVTQGDSTSKYLIETRSKYINLGDFYGSDYYLSRIGYDENSDWNNARRLGDAYYEYLLITRTLSDKLGTRFINGLSDKELMKAMLDNSVELQKDLQLSVGVALTPDQVKALKSDVIWYEYEVVNGEKVLVPKVYLSQATLATIDTDGRNRVGGLELTAINADELRNNGQVIGNGGVTYVNAGRVYNVTNTNELAEIKGNEVTVIATAGNIENIGGRIKGIDSVTLLAENGDIINSSSKVTSSSYGNSNNNTQHENLLSIGEISSGGTTYIEANNYDSKAGILGGSAVILNVKDNVTIGALTLSGEDNSGSGSDNYAVYRSNQNIGGVVSADNLYVSGKNLNIEGSTVAVAENAILNVEKINIESKVDNIYSESKGTDKGTFSSREQHTKSYEEQNVEAQLFVGGSTVTKGDINIIGSTFVTGDDSYLGGNVTATSRELNSSYYHQEKKTGFVSNFDVSSGGMTAGAGIQKTEDTININQKTQAMSNVSLGHGTVVDGDKFSLSATNFQHGAIVVNSKEVYYGATKNTYDEQTEHKESYVGVSASISSPLLNRIDQMYNGVEAASKGNGTAGLVNGGVAVINSAVGTINGLAGNQRGANNNFYVSANVGLTASQSESKSHTYYETGVVTTIRGLDENSSITYNNTEKITYEGTQSYGDTFIYNNVKEIEKKAVELNNYYSSSSSNTSAFGGMTFDTVTGRPGGASFNISGGNSNYTQEGTSYQNGIFIGVNETYNNVGKMTIDGFEQYGGKVTGNIAELDIKSKQNTSKTDGSSSNYSAGTGFQTIGTASGAENIWSNAAKGMNGSIGGSQTTGDRSYVDTPSAFLVGEGSDLSIGKVINTGAVIGTEEGTNSKIKIDEYIGKDIKDKDDYNITGGTIGNGGVGFEYQDKEKEGITHNTVIGNVEIGKSSGDEINRDINNMQETTKDKDSGHYNTFVESGVLALATEQGRKDFKESIELAGTEIDAMKEVVNQTIDMLGNDNGNGQKRGFLDVLQTERIQEGFRNAGYIDLTGKTDTQIEQEIKDKYGDLFARFGKEVEIDFYTISDIDVEDPARDDKMNSQGFVDGTGKIWLNKDNIDESENLYLNNVIGHEGVHSLKGENTELLAQFGQERSEKYINEVINTGKLNRYSENVIDWNKSTLTESEKFTLKNIEVDEMQERIFLAKGLTDGERNQILTELQAITNNKLKIIKTCALKDCYEVVYDKTENNKLIKLGPDLPKSDRLILDLIATKKEVWITNERDPDGISQTKSSEQYYVKGNSIVPDKSYVTISFKEMQESEFDILKNNKVSSEKTPTYIGLSHELIHSYHYLFNPTAYSTNKLTYKALGYSGKLIEYKAREEEIRTVGIPQLNSTNNLQERYKNGAILFFKPNDITENDIRREHNLPYRNNY
jgi:filamentous hemagglutinin